MRPVFDTGRVRQMSLGFADTRYSIGGIPVRKILFVFCLLLLIVPLSARTLPKIHIITDYWPIDESKEYHFFINDEKIGDMSAELTGEEGGIVTIKETLDLDLARLGLGPKLEIHNELQVTSAGYFNACTMDVEANGTRRQLNVTFDSITATARAVIDGNESNARERVLGQPMVSSDNNMISQLELALAFHDLTPGDTITIPVFSPQGMYTADFLFFVAGETEVRYSVYRDTVWQVNMLRPASQTLYIDRKHDLVKIEDSNQNLRVEYQRDLFADRPNIADKAVSGGTVDNLIRRLPFYGLMLLVAVGWLLFLGRDSYRDKWSYVLFVIGGCLYPLIYYIQVPIQQSYAINYLTPIMQSGGSIVLPAAIPALVSGIVQESLKILPLVFAAYILRPKAFVLISIGAFIGAGFGFVEACYISGPVFQARLLTNTLVAERVFALLFHIVTGAILGYGFARRKWWMYWLIAIGFHSLANYLIVFVAMQVISVGGLQAILAVYDLLLLANMFLLQSKFKKGRAGSRKNR